MPLCFRQYQGGRSYMVVGDACEDISETGLWIDAVQLRLTSAIDMVYRFDLLSRPASRSAAVDGCQIFQDDACAGWTASTGGIAAGHELSKAPLQRLHLSDLLPYGV